MSISSSDVSNSGSDIEYNVPHTEHVSIINGYISSRLHGVHHNSNSYPPYFVAKLLLHHRTFTVNGVKVTKFRLIKHLVDQHLVPVKKSSLYKLVDRYASGYVSENTTWTMLAKSGAKPYLTHHEFKELIRHIEAKTNGGLALSTSELRNEIEEAIISSFKKRNDLVLLPSSFPEHTLNTYVSMIKSQDIFNIYGSVSNKTESRSIAEWSIRSTLSYTMIVGTTHFFPDVERTRFHPKKKDLNHRSLEMWNLVEDSYNKMLGISEGKKELLPVLPNMLTTTDEVTIFATTSMVNNKESLYIVAKPTELKNECSSSSSRNIYKQRASGDAHCRGVRIVINSTFTAGGLSAPIFVSVFGLSDIEMPSSEIIIVPVPGLSVGSHQDVYSRGIGFLTFIKGSGKYNNNMSENNETGTANESAPVISKESKIAQLYRQKVFYPFIEHVRKTKYNYEGNGTDIPEHLRCVSWMDGCNSQLRLITSEENMMCERERKITCCKHSAARTAVEQAADTGAMFKILKKIVRSTDLPTAANSSVFCHLEEMFQRLDSATGNDERLHLPCHKKKAILLTLSKLPIASSRAYSNHIIKKAFLLNGQLDIDHKLVPSLDNCINTYQGDINGTCLEQKENIFSQLYEEAYERGSINEGTYDSLDVPLDTNSHGVDVRRNFDVVNENRQRAKCLSSDVQIQERRNLVRDAKMVIYRKKLNLFEVEDKDYKKNEECEKKLMTIYASTTNQKNTDNNNNTTNTTTTSYQPTENEHLMAAFGSMSDMITYDMVSGYHGSVNVMKADMKAFVRVRSNRIVRNGKSTYPGIPDRKKELLLKLVELSHKVPNEKVYGSPPVLPE